MEVFGFFFEAIATVISGLLTLYMYVIIARAILSWVSPDPYNPIVRMIYNLTEPVLYRIRRWLPDLGGIDVSPIIVIFGIIFLKSFLVRTLAYIAMNLR